MTNGDDIVGHLFSFNRMLNLHLFFHVAVVLASNTATKLFIIQIHIPIYFNQLAKIHWVIRIALYVEFSAVREWFRRDKFLVDVFFSPRNCFLHSIYTDTMTATKKMCCGCVPLQMACIIIGVLDIPSLIIAGAMTPPVIIGIASSLLLITGALRTNRHFMWPWIFVNIFSVVVVGIAIIVSVLFSSFVIEQINRQPFYARPSDEEVLDVEMKFAIVFLALVLVFIVVVLRLNAVCKYMKALYEDEKTREVPGDRATIYDYKLFTV